MLRTLTIQHPPHVKRPPVHRVQTGPIVRLAAVVCCLAVLAAAGCGPQDGGIELTIAAGWGPEKEAAMAAALKGFRQQYPHVKVKPISIVGGRYYDKIEVMIAGGVAPDVMWMGQGFTTFASRGAFRSVQELYADIDPEDYYSEVLGWYQIDGEYFGFPTGVDLGCIVYNQDLFDEAGVEHPTEDWTMDTFVAAATKLTLDVDGDDRIDQWGFVGDVPYAAFGGKLLNDDHTRCVLDSPETIAGLQFNIDLFRKHKVSPPPESDSVTSMGTEMSFVMGRVAMWTIEAKQVVSLRKKINTFSWDIAMLPIGPRRAHWASSRGWAVAASTKHPKEAVALLKAMASPVYALQMRGITLPVEKATAAQMVREWTGPPKSIGLLIKMCQTMAANPRVPNISEMVAIYDRHAQLAALGELTAEQAMREAARRINALIEEHRGGK